MNAGRGDVHHSYCTSEGSSVSQSCKQPTQVILSKLMNAHWKTFFVVFICTLQSFFSLKRPKNLITSSSTNTVLVNDKINPQSPTDSASVSKMNCMNGK
mmetsp:Transcript_40/g.152  ORF Transcript_40/g.152 Transcript_40/m.152 type:complete len:99 (+) Transcript_40:458-754(+)